MIVCNFCKKPAAKHGPGMDMFVIWHAMVTPWDHRSFSLSFAHIDSAEGRLNPGEPHICGACLDKTGLLDMIRKQIIEDKCKQMMGDQQKSGLRLMTGTKLLGDGQ